MKIDANIPVQGLEQGRKSQETTGGEQPGFSEMFEKAVNKVNEGILNAEDLSARMAAGEPVDIAQTMIAISKADLQFRLMVQVRNKALGAYEEIMRMQV